MQEGNAKPKLIYENKIKTTAQRKEFAKKLAIDFDGAFAEAFENEHLTTTTKEGVKEGWCYPWDVAREHGESHCIEYVSLY